jgi:hypothetical protein
VDGLPAITSPITIIRNRSAIERSSTTRTPSFRILEISFGQLLLNQVIIRNGIANSGGTILNNGTLNPQNSMLSGYSATSVNGAGRVISNSGMLHIMNSQLFRNSARIGGGIANFELGTARIINSALSTNSDNFAGGISATSGGVVIVNNSLLTRNSAVQYGGGAITSMVRYASQTAPSPEIQPLIAAD